MSANHYFHAFQRDDGHWVGDFYGEGGTVAGPFDTAAEARAEADAMNGAAFLAAQDVPADDDAENAIAAFRIDRALDGMGPHDIDGVLDDLAGAGLLVAGKAA